MLFKRRERPLDGYLPLVHHLTDTVILDEHGGIFSMFALRGAPWETKSAADVLRMQTALNTLYHRNLFHPSVTIHEYRCRTMADRAIYPRGEFRSAFAEGLDAAYSKRLFDNYLYDNRIYLGIEIKPSTLGTTADLLDHMTSITSLMTHSLTPHRPRLLGVRDGRWSEIAEALVFAMTGYWRPIHLTTGRLGQSMFSERIIVGRESIEFEGPGHSWFGCAFGMRHYLTGNDGYVPPGVFDRLLMAPYRHTLYQCYGFMPTYAAQKMMHSKETAMIVGKDPGYEQAAELKKAANGLSSARYCMGEHSLTLLTFALTMHELQQTATAAWSDLSACGATVSREKPALEAAFFSMVPGNSRLRPRPGYTSSVNFTCMAPLHGFPTGDERGHWGEPIALFRTASGEAYRFHLHVHDVANALLCGMVGSGKSTLLAFLLAQSERLGATIVAWDKDRGLKILINELGGTYLELKNPTGIAPLRRLEDTPEDVDFLTSLIRGCILADGGSSLTPDEDDRLLLGIHTVLSLPPEDRWLEEVRAFLGVDANGAGARLDKWCYGHELGWIIDNPIDRVSLDAPALGFDQTFILDNPNARGPVMATLYHYVEKLIDGRRLIFAIDEFWKSLLDPAFRALVNDKLKTLRKRNSPVILVTQSPRDALNADISHTIREQCPTKIFFNCGDAVWEDFGPNGMRLTETEFEAIQGLAHGAGEFLICQGGIQQEKHSVRCQLDLHGLDSHIAVLSGRENTVRLYDQVGGDIAEFHAQKPKVLA